MRNFIIKFVPKNKDGKQVIHKVRMPDFQEPGFYQQVTSWNAFCSGKRRGATEKDKECYQDRCCWAPTGLYYTNEHVEEEWLKHNARMVQRMIGHGMDPSPYDETKLKIIVHNDIYAFYEYIGFDRKRRCYV